jgi:hypothetical protein
MISDERCDPSIGRTRLCGLTRAVAITMRCMRDIDLTGGFSHEMDHRKKIRQTKNTGTPSNVISVLSNVVSG